MSARKVATAALLALAGQIVIGFTVLQGTPNPGMAAAAVLPLLGAWATWTGRRWAPVVTVLSAVTVVALRMTTLSFDLARPGDVAPFALAVATLLTIGVSLVAGVLAGRGAGRPAIVLAGGLATGGVLAAGLLLGFPQSEDTGGLSEEQVAALPTIEMVNFTFEPGQLRVPEGQPVAFRFTNDTDDSHSFAIDAFDLDVQVPSGRTRVVVVEAEPGTYPFHCSVGSHADDGMKGRLVVDGGDHSGHDHGAHGHGDEDSSEAGHAHAH